MHSLYNNYAVPTQVPKNLTVDSVNETNITIQWEPVECLHRNGRIAYHVSYYSDGMAEIVATVNTTGLNTMTFTAVGLLPSIIYTFTVKAINRDLSLPGPPACINITTSMPKGIGTHSSLDIVN